MHEQHSLGNARAKTRKPETQNPWQYIRLVNDWYANTKHITQNEWVGWVLKYCSCVIDSRCLRSVIRWVWTYVLGLGISDVHVCRPHSVMGIIVRSWFLVLTWQYPQTPHLLKHYLWEWSSFLASPWIIDLGDSGCMYTHIGITWNQAHSVSEPSISPQVCNPAVLWGIKVYLLFCLRFLSPHKLVSFNVKGCF